MVVRRAHLDRVLPVGRVAADDGAGRPARGDHLLHLGAQGVQLHPVGQIDALGVDPALTVDVARRGDARVRHVAQPPHVLDRIGDQLVHRQALVLDPVDEGAVGAVLQQPAHQVGQQVLVLADRRVDAAAGADLVVLDDALVELLAHAVQALELEVAGVAGVLQHAGDRVRVVRGQLRKENVAVGEQLARAGQVGDVGVHLAGEDGIALDAHLLGALDLHVPVGALDQAHHEAPLVALAHVGQVVEHVGRALLVGLHDHAEALPVLELRIAGDRLDAVERDVEAVGLLGVDVEADVVLAREQGQLLRARHQLVHHAVLLGELETRVQRGQLDRDPGRVDDATLADLLADGMDRGGVGLHVALRVGVRARALAEHVVGVTVALLLVVARALQGLVDGAAEHELAAEDAHGLAHGLADERLAAARDQAAEHRAQVAVAVAAVLDHLPGQHQRPGGGIDEGRVRVAQVLFPVAAAELVADQPVGGLAVGDAQQRLGQAHQHHALLAGELVLVHEGVDAALADAARAHALDQLAGLVLDPLAQVPGQLQLREQRLDAGLLVNPVMAPHLAAQRVGGRRGLLKDHAVSPLARNGRNIGQVE